MSQVETAFLAQQIQGRVDVSKLPPRYLFYIPSPPHGLLGPFLTDLPGWNRLTRLLSPLNSPTRGGGEPFILLHTASPDPSLPGQEVQSIADLAPTLARLKVAQTILSPFASVRADLVNLVAIGGSVAALRATPQSDLDLLAFRRSSDINPDLICQTVEYLSSLCNASPHPQLSIEVRTCPFEGEILLSLPDLLPWDGSYIPPRLLTTTQGFLPLPSIH